MRRIPCLLLLLCAASCSSPDPFQATGTWHAQGSNAANLRLMVANPDDLVMGRGATGTPAAEAAPPITRLFDGRRTRLPEADASDLDVQAAGLGPAQPASPAAVPMN